MTADRTTTVHIFRIHPYRLFFSLGAVAGMLGVGQWTFWTSGWTIPNVSTIHTTLQAQGFLACFVIGFLFTAFPRFTGAPPAPMFSIALSFGSMVVFVGAASTGRIWMAQIAFLTALIGLGTAMVRSLLRKTKPLSGPFALVGFGLAHAAVGMSFVLAGGMGDSSPYLYSVGRQMVQLGFLLCAVLGVTGRLAPFLMGYFEEEPCDTPLAKMRTGGVAVGIHVLTGAVIAATFLIEPGFPRMALGLRAVVVTLHMAVFARAFRWPARHETYRVFFSISTWMVPAGLCVEALWPVYRVAALHITFIGGFSLMIFSFGSLVVFSHSARASEISGSMWPLRAVGVSVLVALSLRLAADFTANRYMVLIHAASGIWVLAAALWLGYALPKMRGNPASHLEPK